MSGAADQFEEATDKFRDVESHFEGESLHEYDAVLPETGESVRVITLPPELADNDAATDAFARVTDQWDNAATHPNIVSVIDRETTPLPWIALDQPHDLTLDRAQSRLTAAGIETVVTDTAEALWTLGLYNAVYGPLWPDDILVSPDGDDTTVQLRGFGLAHAVRTALGESSATPYAAPELLDNPDQPTEQTDVYRLGAISYFALTGQPPVDGSNHDRALRDGPTAPPSEYNDEVGSTLDETVLQALSASQSDRQESPHVFKRAFISAFETDTFGQDNDRSETTEAEESTAPETTVHADGDTAAVDTSQQPAGDDDDTSHSGVPAEADRHVSGSDRSRLGVLGATATGVSINLLPTLILPVLIWRTMLGTATQQLTYATVYGLLPFVGTITLALFAAATADANGRDLFRAGPSAATPSQESTEADQGPLSQALGNLVHRETTLRKSANEMYLAVRDQPVLITGLTIPLSVFALLVFIVLNWAPLALDGGVAAAGLSQNPVSGTFFWVYAPMYINVVPLAIFYELRARAQAATDHNFSRYSNTVSVAVVILTFFLALGVMALLKTQFLDVMSGLTQQRIGASGGSGGGQFGSNVDTQALSMLFFHTVTLQALLSSAIAGYLSEAKLTAGTQFALVLTTITLGVWVGVG